MTWKDEVILEDLEFSGDKVWPVIYSEHAADRLIFRRPELAYRVALRRMRERRKKKGESEEILLVRIRIIRSHVVHRKDRKQRKTRTIRRFIHTLITTSEQEDVEFFLEKLRRHLMRVMPDRPLLNCSVQLCFDDTDQAELSVVAWQGEWL